MMNLKLITRKRIFWMTCGLLLALGMTAWDAGNDQQQVENFMATEIPKESENSAQLPMRTSFGEKQTMHDAEKENDAKENEAIKIILQVGERAFTATMEENTAAAAFAELMEAAPVVIQMSDYSGFEKVGALGTGLPANDSRISTQPGDIVLYNGNQIVIFYGAHSWSYTRLGKIDDLTGWEEALGSGEVTVTFSVNRTAGER